MLQLPPFRYQINNAAVYAGAAAGAPLTPPAVAGAAVTGIKSGGGALTTAALTTTGSNRLIIIISSVEGRSVTTPNVTSVTGGGLTFSLRKRNNLDTGGAFTGFPSVELWWAVAPSVLSAVAFTVNYASGYDDAAAIAFAVSGGNTSAPWDTNVSLPSAASGGTPTFTGISTTSPSLLLMVLGNAANTSYTEPSGWAAVGNVLNGGGTLFAWAHVSSKTLSATVSGVTYSASATGATSAGILDALAGT